MSNKAIYLLFCVLFTASIAYGAINSADWEPRSAGNPTAKLETVFEDGIEFLQVTPVDDANYQGVKWNKSVDVSACDAQSRIIFQFKSSGLGNFYCYITQTDGSTCYRLFEIEPGKTQKIELDLIPKNWNGGGRFRTIKSIDFYASDMKKPYKFNVTTPEFTLPNNSSIPDKHRIENITYKYSAPPERGDASGKMLTDGKINPVEEQTFWGIRTDGEPGIIFDLGKKYFINEIKLQSHAIPSQNYQAVIISSSDNGIDWQTVSSIKNTNGGRVAQDYDITGTVNAAGRFFRLAFNRAKVDNAIEISEVEFWGSDRLAPQQVSGTAVSRPNQLAVPDFKAAKSEHFIFLRRGAMEVAIARNNGAVAGIRIDGHDKVIAGFEEYFLETRNKQFSFSELDDQVMTISEQDNDVIIETENPKLPQVRIVKQYTLSSDGSRLKKKITLKNISSVSEPAFVTLQTNTLLDNNYRKNGFYFGADWGLGGRMSAEQVKFDIANVPHAAGNSKIGFFINRNASSNLGQYLLKVNEKPVSATITLWQEKDNIPLTYTISGWKFGLATIPVNPKQTSSLEYEYIAFAGSDLDFYRAYRVVPEIKERYDKFAQAPDWLQNIKCSVAGSVFAETVSNLSCFDADGFVFALLSGPSLWGDWVGKGVGVTGYGDLIPFDEIKEDFRLLKERFPFGRFGIYTWAWSGSPMSQTYKQHPDWFFCKDKNGMFWSAYGCGCAQNFLRDVGNPDSRKALLDGAGEIMKNLNCDFFYLDGGCGGTNVIDWPSSRVSQIYDWDAFHEALKEKIKESGNEKIMFFNSRSEWVYDFGFIEGIQGRFSQNLWRDSADALYAMKIRQKLDPLRKVSPIYWLDDSAQYYANYCIGLGLPPTVWSNIVPRIAYISAAYENRNYELQDAVYSPDWRYNLLTSAEIYSLKNRQSGILSIISHDKSLAPLEIKVDRKSLGLSPSDKLWIWKFTLADIAPRLANRYGLSEPLSAGIYKNSNFGCNLIANPKFLGIALPGEEYILNEKFAPEILSIVVLSPGPAAIYSINGRRTNFWQPSSGDINLNSVLLDNNKIELRKTGVFPVESIIHLPENWGNIQVSGAKLNSILFQDKNRFAIISLPAGEVTAEIQPLAKNVKYTWETVSKPNLELTSDLLLKISCPDFSSDRSSVTVSITDANSIAVYNNLIALPGKIQLPRELQSGKYQVSLHAVDPVGKIRESVCEFNLNSAWRYVPESSARVCGRERQHKEPVIKVTPVNKKIGSVNILATGIDSHDNFDGMAYVDIDAGNKTLTVGGLDHPASWAGVNDYAFAGFEIENLKKVSVKAVSNMKNIYAEFAVEPNFPYAGKNSFGGIMIDYHTPRGYAYRVALGLGKISPERSFDRPRFGFAKIPNRYVVIDDLFGKKEEQVYTFDLTQWAPADWDGKVWLIAGTDGVAPQRRLKIEILDNETAGRNTTAGSEIGGTLPEWTMPRIPENQVRIDGKINEPVWDKALKQSKMYEMPTLNDPEQKTVIWLAYDKKNIYLAARLDENSGRPFRTAKENLWENDGLDIAFGTADNAFRQQIIVDCAGRVLQNTTENLKSDGVKQKKWDVTVAATTNGKICDIEIAIPRDSIGLNKLQNANGCVKFNVARYRVRDSAPEKGEIYSLTPIREWNLMKPALFGDLKW